MKLPSRRRRRPLSGDPRAQALVAAAWTLYQELEPDDEIASVALMARSSRYLVSYSLIQGDSDVRRLVVDLEDEEAIARGEVIDVTVPDSPP